MKMDFVKKYVPNLKKIAILLIAVLILTIMVYNMNLFQLFKYAVVVVITWFFIKFITGKPFTKLANSIAIMMYVPFIVVFIYAEFYYGKIMPVGVMTGVIGKVAMGCCYLVAVIIPWVMTLNYYKKNEKKGLAETLLVIVLLLVMMVVYIPVVAIAVSCFLFNSCI